MAKYNKKSVSYKGTIYESMVQLIRETGISERTAYRMLNRGEITKNDMLESRTVDTSKPNWKNKLNELLSELF